jgi:cytochrome c oxidase subunit II
VRTRAAKAPRRDPTPVGTRTSERIRLAQRVVKPKTNLGPGFWPVTAFIAVVSAIMVYLVYTSPLPIGLIQAGAPADSTDELFRFLGAVAAVIFNIVVIYTVYFGIVFARPKNAPPNTIGVQIHDAPVLEFWWTAIPTILVIILSIYSVKIWADLQNTQGDVLTVEAIGYQFGFMFRYPKLATPVQNELHLPLDTPTTIHITSRDVIHGFWIPEFRNKADMVPGLITTIRVTPKVAGRYRIVCTEFCGVLHGGMKAVAVVESQQDFAKWFRQQGGGGGSAGGGGGASGIPIAQGKADAGQTLFGQKCSACHSTGPFDQKQVGPGLGRVLNDSAHPNLVNGKPATPDNVAAIIHDGYQGDIGVMPSAQVNQLSNGDIANLVAYLASLSKK